MTLRAVLLLFMSTLLTACVTTGDVNPLKTDKGQDEARDAYIQLGIGYLQQGNTGSAKIPLKQALELDPSNADAHVALAVVFQSELETELADEHFRKALSSRSDDTRILNNYGGFLYEQKRYPEAMERFQQASVDNLYQERSRVFENMGLTALMLKQREQAKTYFERALRLNSRQPTALLEMSVLTYEDKNYVQAKGYYENYIVVSEHNSRSLLLGSRLAGIFEDRDKAASLGLQLKRLYPGSPEYQQYVLEQR
ncbi:MAG: type IV pilus biogenesis/stability protein PilW [Pseudomonas sp.]|uniref:type IV pilus biogenesis/stability protein PilW n=1 Tax=Pseudomonas sp. TaxID=306 RepID=UPI0027371086|nr:type IV pilus biogenesis/stability protein PilW [Pseudomonas sp.]MDP3848239.1 type IV pilus biogenesis/stability protein PilW [Pseudomonas sp.]